MTGLYFGRKSLEILTAWRQSSSTTDNDRRLVSEVLKTVEADTWRGRWYYAVDEGAPHTIHIQPQDRLYIVLRGWGDSYEFLTVFRLPDEDDEESLGDH